MMKCDTHHNDIQHNGKVGYAECHCANVANNNFMLSVVMMNAIMLSFVAPCALCFETFHSCLSKVRFLTEISIEEHVLDTNAGKQLS